MSDVTQILQAIQRGDAQASDELLPIVYEELRRLAAHKMAGERAGHTLQPTALVHEAWLRLSHGKQGWQNRAHFITAAVEAMRRILVESARRKHRQKRAGHAEHVDLDEVEIAHPGPSEEILAVNEVMDRFQAAEAEAASVVQLCYWGGFTQPEAAQHLGISLATVERRWKRGCAWLFQEIRQSPATEPSKP